MGSRRNHTVSTTCDWPVNVTDPIVRHSPLCAPRTHRRRARSDLLVLPSGLYPACAKVALSDGSGEPGALFPLEAEAVRNAVEKRRREFAFGRECARRALREWGVTDAELPVDANRAPAWPRGFVGSITHSRGFIGAMVAPDTCLSALGFDAEVAEPLAADLERLVCTSDELAWARRSPLGAAGWPKVLFSAKEAVHKCASPLYGVMLDFLDVTLRPGADNRSLIASASAPGRADGVDLGSIAIRIAVTGEFVFACAFVAMPPGTRVQLQQD